MEISFSLGVGDTSWRHYTYSSYGGLESYDPRSLVGDSSNDTDYNATSLLPSELCTKLLDDKDLRDGRIPAVLGINFAVWVVGARLLRVSLSECESSMSGSSTRVARQGWLAMLGVWLSAHGQAAWHACCLQGLGAAVIIVMGVRQSHNPQLLFS